VAGTEVPGAATGEHGGGNEKISGSTSDVRCTVGARVVTDETSAATWSVCSFTQSTNQYSFIKAHKNIKTNTMQQNAISSSLV